MSHAIRHVLAILGLCVIDIAALVFVVAVYRRRRRFLNPTSCKPERDLR